MSYQNKTYVIIPKDYDFENHISILESTGINVDIKLARQVLKDATAGGCHCQDYAGKCNSYIEEIEDGYLFALRVLKDLGMILFTYNTGQSGNASIRNIKDNIISKKEIILRLLTE